MSSIIQHQTNVLNFGGKRDKIEYIVIHYTANNGDTAAGNATYFANNNTGTSAHYFVDEYDKYYQSVPDNYVAYHCGANTYYHNKCRNVNSIGIEMCSRKDSLGNYYIKAETIDNALILVNSKMKEYNIPIENVLRHYDVTHKNCPAPMVSDINLWNEFKYNLKSMMGDMTLSEYKELLGKIEETNQAIKALSAQVGTVYRHTGDLPDWGKQTVTKLIAKGYLADSDNLGLSYDLLRVLVINDRAGLYD